MIMDIPDRVWRNLIIKLNLQKTARNVVPQLLWISYTMSRELMVLRRYAQSVHGHASAILLKKVSLQRKNCNFSNVY